MGERVRGLKECSGYRAGTSLDAGLFTSLGVCYGGSLLRFDTSFRERERERERERDRQSSAEPFGEKARTSIFTGLLRKQSCFAYIHKMLVLCNISRPQHPNAHPASQPRFSLSSLLLLLLLLPHSFHHRLFPQKE